MGGSETQDSIGLASSLSGTRQEKLDACVALMASREGVPPFCQHAHEVLVRTLNLGNGSSSALACVVLKDLGLSSQVLRAANSSLYNHSGRPILNLTEGILLLGWDALRNLVSTVRYIDHFAHRSPGLRELMLLSLLTAMHSREIAGMVGYPRPDEAYLCGLFRNLGEVLVACHCPEEYARIMQTVSEKQSTLRAACLEVLDFSWDEAGRRVAGGWNLPPAVGRCQSGMGRLAGSPEERCLASITEYARDLTHRLYREGAGSVRPPALVDIEGRRVELPAGELDYVARCAIEESRHTFAALGISSPHLRLASQGGRAQEGQAPAAFDPRALDRAAEYARHAPAPEDRGPTPVIQALLDALTGAGFEHAVFSLLNADHTFIRGRLSSGPDAEDVLNRFDFPADELGGPFHAALDYRADVLLDGSRDGRFQRSALVSAMRPAVFALFPIVADRKLVGCLYADRRSAATGLEAMRGPLGRVRDAMAAAIGRAHAPRP